MDQDIDPGTFSSIDTVSQLLYDVENASIVVFPWAFIIILTSGCDVM